jgi:hypothetical protein
MGNSSISGRIALPVAATRRPDALRREGVELRTRLPEVDHAPAIGVGPDAEKMSPSGLSPRTSIAAAPADVIEH